MRIVIAPDSYKGSLSALEAAEAVKEGLLRQIPGAEIVLAPIADGGEGTVEALVSATGGEYRRSMVRGPLGAPVEAVWGVLGDGRTAVAEMAAASGLPLLRADQRQPLESSTFGTGELVKAVLEAGLARLILGLGGSATNDGGTGFAAALGVRFLDEAGRELPPGGAALARLAAIDLSGLDPRLEGLEIMAACDVDNPLCGPRGASAVFGPQKGASPEMAETLDKALGRYGRLAAEATGRDVAGNAGAGAAGGLGAGLMFFTPAQLRPGIDIVLEALDFESLVKGAALLITGEGRTDFQTAYGKAPVGAARIAKKHSVPVVCLSGALGEGYKNVYAHGIDAAMSASDGPMSLDEALKAGRALVAEAGERLARLIKVGHDMKF